MPTSQVTGRPSFFARADHLDAGRGRQPAEVHARAGGAHELQQRWPARWSRRTPECRAGRAASPPRRRARRRRLASQRSSARSQTGKPKVAAYCMRAPQHLRVGDRHVRLREGDAAGFGELGHLGEALARELHGQRADRVDVRALERLRAPAQHVDEARLVERRIGVRRAGEAGHAARHRGVHFRFERRLVLVARLAQPRREVDEARRDDQALRVDGAVRLCRACRKSCRRRRTRRRLRRCRSPGRRRGRS